MTDIFVRRVKQKTVGELRNDSWNDSVGWKIKGKKNPESVCFSIFSFLPFVPVFTYTISLEVSLQIKPSVRVDFVCGK